jgi:hypothetical protein
VAAPQEARVRTRRDPKNIKALFERAAGGRGGSDLARVLWDVTTERTGPLRLVHGYVAQDARRFGLTKITKASAQKVYNAGLPLFFVGSKVNTFHFFDGWYLGYVMWPEEGESFESRYNNYNAYLEPELGKPTTFLFGIPPLRRRGRR